jgi:hypothetical protein
MKEGTRLFNNNPKGYPRTKGTGYKNANKARKTLKLIKHQPLTYQKQVVITMLYRAKHHLHPTEGMKEARTIYSKWLRSKTRKQPK